MGKIPLWLTGLLDIHTDGCIEYPFSVTKGYRPRFSTRRGAKVSASRFLCELMNGPAPEGKEWALHSCGNGHLNCVNPRHLRWGSPKENSHDRLVHGRTLQGERNCNAKLTDDVVREIKAMKSRGESFTAVSRHFGVSPGTLSNIWYETAWKHVTI